MRDNSTGAIVVLLATLALFGGCAASKSGVRTESSSEVVYEPPANAPETPPAAKLHDSIELIAFQNEKSPADNSQEDLKSQEGLESREDLEAPPSEIPIPPRLDQVPPAPDGDYEQADEMDPDGEEQSGESISLVDVVASIHMTFPLLEAAYQENVIAAGNQIAAWGAFDTKLKAGSESGPLGFYETYRNRAGISQPIYSGGELFGGYRNGRGQFQPWYLERQTNDGGEFKAGVNVPFLRNRAIDARRAELWRATYDRQIAAPEVRAQLLLFVRDGSVAYWEWLAAGRRVEIGEQALDLALRRNSQLERRVDEGDIDPPVLQDNLRAIAAREAKVIDLKRKLQQVGYKLSLFYRTSDGVPLVPDESQLAAFPDPFAVSEAEVENDTAIALVDRPELSALDAMTRRVQVDLAEAGNDMLPAIDAQLVGSQDVGAPTSSKRDKSEFELEAGVFFDVPVQRRKGRGKSQAAQAKLIQIAAKRRFTVDKISAEIQSAVAALTAAFEKLGRARESKRLADYMADVERRKFELGESDLLAVVLREQIAIEAAQSEVDALFDFFAAQADYNAAIARDWPGN